MRVIMAVAMRVALPMPVLYLRLAFFVRVAFAPRPVRVALPMPVLGVRHPSIESSRDGHVDVTAPVSWKEGQGRYNAGEIRRGANPQAARSHATFRRPETQKPCERGACWVGPPPALLAARVTGLMDVALSQG